MAAVARRWWPDNRPPRSAAAAAGVRNKRTWANAVPNPLSAKVGAGQEKRPERGFWAPQGGQFVNGPRGLQYVPARKEPPEWKEPRKKLNFPRPTPQKQQPTAEADKENARAQPPEARKAPAQKGLAHSSAPNVPQAAAQFHKPAKPDEGARRPSAGSRRPSAGRAAPRPPAPVFLPLAAAPAAAPCSPIPEGKEEGQAEEDSACIVS